MKNFVILALTLLFTLISVIFRVKIIALDTPKYIGHTLFFTMLAAPIIYILLLGYLENMKREKLKKLFTDAGFIGKDGRTPYLIKQWEEDKKVLYLFKSNIPLDDWRKTQRQLEVSLECNILLFQEGTKKSLTQLITVPSSCRIPSKIDWLDSYTQKGDGEVVVGVSALKQITFNLNKTPHVLIAGETGSGKSVILRTLARQMYLKGSRLYMIDFKGGVEFGLEYEKFGEVVTNRERALEILNMLVAENEKRLNLFRAQGVKNLGEYNKKHNANLCRIAVLCDEIGEMLDKKGAGKEEKTLMEQIEKATSTLARLSRATGINLLMGVQRPDANVLTGQIKNNIPVRISGRFADKAASEIVLGTTDAVNLPDIKGRFLYKMGNDIEIFQAYYFDDDTMLTEVSVVQGEMLISKKVLTETKKDIKDIKNTKGIEDIKDIKDTKNIKNIKNTEDTKNRNTENIGERFVFDFDFDDEDEEGR